MIDDDLMQRLLTFLALAAASGLLAPKPLQAAEQAKTAARPASSPAQPAKQQPRPPPLVDINSASRAELKTLPGIGDAEADRIIAARPYPSKAKLAADKVLSMDAYLALKGRIVAAQGAAPKGKSDNKGGSRQ